MAYEKYATEAFLIGERNIGESDRTLKFFTKNFGRIVVVAKGIRKLSSKLKSHIDFCFPLKVTLVKGKEVWRLVDASHNTSKTLDSYSKRHFMKTIGLLVRLIHGEGENNQLFLVLKEYFIFLSDNHDQELLSGAELLVALFILEYLGYGNNEYKNITKDFSIQNVKKCFDERKNISSIVNRVLLHTHL